jgi:serine/threonine-protein kinase
MSHERSHDPALAPTMAGVTRETVVTLDAASVSGTSHSATHESGGALSSAPSILAGRWVIQGLIGAGGMGAVYRAHDRELDDVVALKMLRSDLLGADGIERFRREVKLARKVTHKNVARVFDMGEHEGVRFFTMECVEGESLRGVVAREGALGLARVLSFGREICRGLAAAHEVGVIHRDLKPDNVLVGLDGRVALTDFGIAASMDAAADGSKSTSFLGTPAYMAPEQVDRASPIGPGADIYAVGALLFELATGQPPFKGDTALALAVARLVQPPPDPRALRPDLPRELAEIILRAMARKSEDRFPSAEALGQALDLVPTHESLRTIPPGRLAPGPRRDVVKRLAILPLDNAGRPEDAYLASGLTEDLIDAVSMAKGIRVAARGLVAGYEGRRDVDERAVGRELGVDVVASGSLRRMADGRIRVTLRLISAQDGIQIWAQRFDRNEADILMVNEEAAAAIASALSVQAPEGGERHLSDPEAVDLYLRARSVTRSSWLVGARAAADLFCEALARAPDHPLLLAGYATTLARLTFFSIAYIDEARKAAELALERAPNLGEGHLAMSMVALQTGELGEALRHGREALRRSPLMPDAHLILGRVLSEIGPREAALRALTAALELDPTSGTTLRELARVHALFGEHDRAADLLARTSLTDSAEENVSSLISAIRFAIWRKDRTELTLARDRLVAADVTSRDLGMPTDVIARNVTELLEGGPLAPPEKLAQVVGPEVGGVRRTLFFLQIAVEANAFAGDTEGAIARLEKAIEVGLFDLLWLENASVLQSVRDHAAYPRLHAILLERAERARRAGGM